MGVVVEQLFNHRCSMAPILSGDPNGKHPVCKTSGPLHQGKGIKPNAHQFLVLDTAKEWRV